MNLRSHRPLQALKLSARADAFDLMLPLAHSLHRRLFHNAHFGTSEYWKKFYDERAGAQFEWFLSAEDAMSELQPVLHNFEGTMLHVGCGTSGLGHALACTPGCKSVVNVDYSAEAIAAAMAAHSQASNLSHASCAPATFVQADCRSLDVTWSNQFDLVVDKGTFDAVQIAGSDDCQKFLHEMRRVLKKPGGKLLSLTDDIPEQRLDLLRGFLPDAAHSFREASSGDGNWTYYVYMSTIQG